MLPQRTMVSPGLDRAGDRVGEVLLGFAAGRVPGVVREDHEHVCAAERERPGQVAEDALVADGDSGADVFSERDRVEIRAGRQVAVHVDSVDVKPGSSSRNGIYSRRHAGGFYRIYG